MTADGELADAARRAAQALRVQGPLPRRSEDVLRVAVRDQLHAAGVHDVELERSNIRHGWSPLPRGLDLFAGPRPHRWAAEAKVWDISHQIWDALKLVAGIAGDDLHTGYLLAVASPSAFSAQDGRELFTATAPREIATRQLIESNARAWQELLNGGSARPVVLPAAFTVQTIVDAPCWYGHRLRLVAILNLQGEGAVRFNAGWPGGVDPGLASTRTHRRTVTDAAGLAVPAHWSDDWWLQQRRRGVIPEQFEALYGLLLTRGWTDSEMRERLKPAPGTGPPWWT